MKVPFVNLRAQYEAVKPQIDAAIASVLSRSAYVGGPDIEDLERWFADYCGVGHAIGVSSGTRALELVLRALNNYGLPHSLRMTIGTEEANRLVVDGLRDFVAGK